MGCCLGAQIEEKGEAQQVQELAVIHIHEGESYGEQGDGGDEKIGKRDEGISEVYEDDQHNAEEVEAYELPVRSSDVVVYLCKTYLEEGECYESC
jgi:hypothetical protein